jgi:hypothetical protein
MNCVRTIVLPVDINTEGCLQTYTAGLSMLLGAIGGEFSCITAWTNAGLRIRDIYPGSSFLPIPDPKTALKERGEKKLVVIPFFVAINFTKFKSFYF